MDFYCEIMDSKKSFRNKKEVNKEKKQFNKKRWRELHYSTKKKGKFLLAIKVEFFFSIFKFFFLVEQWDEVRKKSLIKKYHKELKKSGINVPVNTQPTNLNREEKKHSALQLAQEKYKKIQEEKQRRKEELQRQKEERQAALEAYKKQKAMKFKKLSQKTRKGQPVMKGRMELLLEKIQKNFARQT